MFLLSGKSYSSVPMPHLHWSPYSSSYQDWRMWHSPAMSPSDLCSVLQFPSPHSSDCPVLPYLRLLPHHGYRKALRKGPPVYHRPQHCRRYAKSPQGLHEQKQYLCRCCPQQLLQARSDTDRLFPAHQIPSLSLLEGHRHPLPHNWPPCQ